MEELHRNLLLNIPLKVPDKLEWTPYLLNYIRNSYAEDALKYEQDCHIIDGLRERSINQATTSTFVIEDLSM